jgi:hypothetical protein
VTTTITRVYADRSHANAVVEELGQRGYRKGAINVVYPDAATSEAAFAGAIVKGGVFASSAKLYAAAVKRGGTLVTTVAPFGAAVTAMNVMDTGELIDAGVRPTEQFESTLHAASPLSSALGWSVLSRTAAPLSKMFGLPTRTRGATPAASTSPSAPTLPFATLSKSSQPAASVSRMKQVLPFPTLLRRQGPILPFPTISRDEFDAQRK